MEKQLINILLEAEIERQDILCGLLYSLFAVYFKSLFRTNQRALKSHAVSTRVIAPPCPY